jgi:hypothetical protein
VCPTIGTYPLLVLCPWLHGGAARRASRLPFWPQRGQAGRAFGKLRSWAQSYPGDCARNVPYIAILLEEGLLEPIGTKDSPKRRYRLS